MVNHKAAATYVARPTPELEPVDNWRACQKSQTFFLLPCSIPIDVWHTRT